mmetsp:Transcript_9632/g.23342  ORF Transcript_9632/g.23342 Transcript_9632/m.23342 type:complete len:350 (+) Transcript_9632:923-1972(+)
MQPERGGRVARELLLDVLEVLLVAQVGRRRLELGEEGEPVHQLLLEEGREVRVAQPAVPRVGDVAAVHDLAKDVAQVVPRHLGRVVQKVGRDDDAHLQVALVERVAAVPADGPKLAPFAHDRVEEAEREDDRLELGRLGRVLPDGIGEVEVRALQVGLEAARRLVGELDRFLQDGHRHDRLRHRGEEAAEERVRALLERLELLLELGQPGRHELDVLEHRPAAVGVHLVQRLLGDRLLPLPQRDRDQLAAIFVHHWVHRLAERAHLRRRVDARREQEEDGHRRARVLERDGQVEVDRLAVPRPEHRHDPRAQRQRDAVGPDGAHDEQLLEAAEPLPVSRQLLGLGRRVL